MNTKISNYCQFQNEQEHLYKCGNNRRLLIICEYVYLQNYLIQE